MAAVPPKPCRTKRRGAGSPLERSTIWYDRIRPSAVVIDSNPGGTRALPACSVAGALGTAVVVAAAASVVSAIVVSFPASLVVAEQPAKPTSEMDAIIGSNRRMSGQTILEAW